MLELPTRPRSPPMRATNVILVVMSGLVFFAPTARAADDADIASTIRALQERIEKLEGEVKSLKATVAQLRGGTTSSPQAAIPDKPQNPRDLERTSADVKPD